MKYFLVNLSKIKMYNRSILVFPKNTGSIFRFPLSLDKMKFVVVVELVFFKNNNPLSRNILAAVI